MLVNWAIYFIWANFILNASVSFRDLKIQKKIIEFSFAAWLRIRKERWWRKQSFIVILKPRVDYIHNFIAVSIMMWCHWFLFNSTIFISFNFLILFCHVQNVNAICAMEYIIIILLIFLFSSFCFRAIYELFLNYECI